MNVIFVLPFDYLKVGGIRLPIEQYKRVYKEQGYDVREIMAPYRFKDTDIITIKESLKQNISKQDNNCIISYSLNISYEIEKILSNINYNGKKIAYLADSMALYAKSIFKRTKLGKRKFDLGIRLLLYRYKEKSCVKFYDNVIYASCVDKHYVENEYHKISSNIYCIPNGYNMPTDNMPVANITSEVRFGCLFEFSKATMNDEIEPLIKCIFPAIKKQFKGARLIIAGGGATQEFLNLILNAEGVEYIGYVEKLSSFYNNIDIILTVAKKECGIINRIMEAWAYKRVVIGYEQNFLAFDNVKNGIHYLGAEKPNEFIDKVNMLYDNNLYGFLANNAYEYVAKECTWKNREEKIIEVLS